jgi:hypothetical protein
VGRPAAASEKISRHDDIFSPVSQRLELTEKFVRPRWRQEPPAGPRARP